MTHRIAKINSFLAKEISLILKKELALKPSVLISVSKVETSADLRHSRIFLSIIPAQEENYVLKTLKKEIYFIQGCLNERMTTKIIPHISFITDKRPKKIEEIENIFQEIAREKKIPDNSF